VLTWVILTFNALMLVGLIVGVNSASDKGKDCGTSEACQAGNDIGTALGVGAVLFVWVAGAIILGVIWLVTNKASGRPARRPEPPPPPAPHRW